MTTTPAGWHRLRGRTGTELVRWQYIPNPDGTFDVERYRQGRTEMAPSLAVLEALGLEPRDYSVVVGRVWRAIDQHALLRWSVDVYELGIFDPRPGVLGDGTMTSGKVPRPPKVAPGAGSLAWGAESAEPTLTLVVAAHFARLPPVLEHLAEGFHVVGHPRRWQLHCKRCRKLCHVYRPPARTGELFPDPVDASQAERHVSACGTP